MATLTIHPESGEQLQAIKTVLKAMKIPFEKQKEKESSYNPEFIKKINESKKQFENGEFDVIKTDDLWK